MVSKTSYQWTVVEGKPVNVMKCGEWRSREQSKTLFLIIPGNPGSMGFYQTFAEALYEESGVPVWGIAHTGHMTFPNDLPGSQLHPSVEECGLTNQISHKISFLKSDVLPEVDEVYLIGHSIGCYIILHILDQMKEEKLKKGIMLFPTIERMAVSPKGRRLTPVLKNFRSMFYYFAWSMSFLPHFVKKTLVSCLFLACNDPSKQAVLNDVISPAVADCSSYMGLEEMLVVKERDDKLIREHGSKLHFYYGTVDHWCPVSYYEDMIKDFEDVDVRLCKNRFKHAFVLREAEPMASIVADMAKSF